ncbi:MAG: hypothetical protein WAP51_03710 [Candidatus Sungiibacteriota bacterium]
MKKSKAQNSKFKTNSKFKIPNHKHFGFWILDFGFPQRGITLLLVILVLTSLLSISLGIFTVVFSQLRLSGEIADSFVALYAANEAIERGLYLDRNQPVSLCTPVVGVGCQYVGSQVQLSNGSCYILKVDKTLTANPYTFDVNMRATGEYRCGGDILSVKRALQTSYTQSIPSPE